MGFTFCLCSISNRGYLNSAGLLLAEDAAYIGILYFLEDIPIYLFDYIKATMTTDNTMAIICKTYKAILQLFFISLFLDFLQFLHKRLNFKKSNIYLQF